MPNDGKYVIFKYAENDVSNTIEKHKDVIKEYGFCWMGKLGKTLSSKAIDIINSSKKVILYVKGSVYIASVDCVSEKVQHDNIPEYYIDNFYKNGIYPSIYMKLTEISEEDISILDNIMVESTLKPVGEKIGRCMSPIIFGIVNSNKNEGVN